MDILESLYEKPPHALNVLDRKINIDKPNTLLIGPNGAGKTTLMLDFLSKLSPKTYIYIDFNDLRIKKEDLTKNLLLFYQKYNLSLVVIDNYESDFLLNGSMNFLLSSNDHSLKIDGLETLFLDALDFEEFIAFSKSASVESLFSLYANYGRQPKAASLHDFEILNFLQSKLQLELLDFDILKIFCYMATHQSRPVSLHYIYKNLKPSMKLSKDKLYTTAEMFLQKHLIHFVPKHKAPKTAKKIFLNDFALKNALTFEKDFIRRFENIVFCELLWYRSEIFYTERVDFYIPEHNQAIVCIPFLPPELILRRFRTMLTHLKSLNVSTLTVVTVGNEGKGAKEGMYCEILPFWEWALRQ